MRIKRQIVIVLLALLLVMTISIITKNDNNPKSVVYPPSIVMQSKFWQSIMGIKTSKENLGILIKLNLNAAAQTRTYLEKEIKRITSPCANLLLEECATVKVVESLDAFKDIEKSSEEEYALRLSKNDVLSLMLIRAFRSDNARYKPVNIPYKIEEIKAIYENLRDLRNEEKT